MSPKSKGAKAASAALDITDHLQDAKGAWSRFAAWRRKHVKRQDGGAAPDPEASAAQLATAIAFLDGADSPAPRAAAAAGAAAAADAAAPARFMQQLVRAHAVKDVADACITPHLAPAAGGAAAAPPPRLPPAARADGVALLRDAADGLAGAGLGGARSMTALRLRAQLLDMAARLLEGGDDEGERAAVRAALADCVLEGLAPGWENEAAFVNVLMEQPPFAAESVGRRSTLPELAAAWGAAWGAFNSHLRQWGEDARRRDGTDEEKQAREAAFRRCMGLALKAGEAGKPASGGGGGGGAATDRKAKADAKPDAKVRVGQRGCARGLALQPLREGLHAAAARAAPHRTPLPPRPAVRPAGAAAPPEGPDERRAARGNLDPLAPAQDTAAEGAGARGGKAP
jgi:hypothetical protein